MQGKHYKKIGRVAEKAEQVRNKKKKKRGDDMSAVGSWKQLRALYGPEMARVFENEQNPSSFYLWFKCQDRIGWVKPQNFIHHFPIQTKIKEEMTHPDK